LIQNAIILAAGTGSRLKPLTDHAPKCLTEINGNPIMTNALENLQRTGVSRCTIVVGYLADVVQRGIGNKFGDIDISYILNTRFSSTNDMYSLWLARHSLESGCILLEGDIFFRAPILLHALTNNSDRSCYLAGRYNGKMDEILIYADEHNLIRSIEVLRGKQGEQMSHHYMSTGILIIQSAFGKQFSRWLTDSVRKNDVHLLFDDVLGEHVHDEKLYISEVAQNEWVEIDNIDDVAEAELTFGNAHP
jgi:CTP:phosphocholine cytidylyltransferase-like protein